MEMSMDDFLESEVFTMLANLQEEVELFPLISSVR